MEKTYAVKLEDAPKKYLERCSVKTREQIARKLRTLATDPRLNASKLKGSGYYRIRSGNYRIVFKIRDNVLLVLVIAIGDRGNIYKKLKRLLR